MGLKQMMEIKQLMQMMEMTNQRRSKGRKASHKTMPPSKIGIPEFRERIVNASSEGKIRLTPHLQ